MKYAILLLCVLYSVQQQALAQDQTCNTDCNAGAYRVDQKENLNCTSICVKCPAASYTNSTNSAECISCPTGEASTPDRTTCQKYDVITYALSRPLGVIIVILMIVTLVLILFAFVIFSRNRGHDLVVMSNYYGLCFFLFGCLLLLFSPVPLLTKPLVSSCSVYIALFNVGLTVLFSVLISRSAFVNGFYNENNEVTRSGCGGQPRVVAIVLVLLVQLGILIVGLTMMKPNTYEIETSQWNIYYLECSNWASYVFWISFGYNVLLSLFGNFLSCSSTQMDEICEELKLVLISYLAFYVLALLDVILLFRVINEALAEGQAILCILYTLAFYSCYIAPKIYVILFDTKDDGTTIKPERLLHDHEHHESHATSLIHAKDGYKHHVVGMKIKSIVEA